MVNEASLLAARYGSELVDLRLLVAGVQRTRFGVDGRSGGSAVPGAAWAQQLGSWLGKLTAPADKRVKVSTS